jgi:hypothetical protein
VLASVSGNGLFDPNLRGGDGPAVAGDLPPVGHNAFLRSATRAAIPHNVGYPLNSAGCPRGAGHARPDEAVPRDERGQLVFGHPLRTFRALR